MNATPVKTLASAVFGIGTGFVAQQALKSVLPPAVQLPVKVLTAVGVYVVGTFAADHVARQTEAGIDLISDAVGEMKSVKKN